MKVRDMAVYAIYLAIFLLMGLVPYLGYIVIGPVRATLMCIPVVLVTIHKGWKGAIFGTFMFGITSVMAAAVQGSIFIGLLGWGPSFVIFFIGRMLILAPLLLFLWISSKYKINAYISAIIISLIISIFNTIFVLSLAVAFNFKSYTFWSFFSLVSINIAVEWTVPVFISASLSSFGILLRNRDKTHKRSSY